MDSDVIHTTRRINVYNIIVRGAAQKAQIFMPYLTYLRLQLVVIPLVNYMQNNRSSKQWKNFDYTFSRLGPMLTYNRRKELLLQYRVCMRTRDKRCFFVCVQIVCKWHNAEFDFKCTFQRSTDCVDIASRSSAKGRQTTLKWQKQVFVHTRLSRAYLALARLSCTSL